MKRKFKYAKKRQFELKSVILDTFRGVPRNTRIDTLFLRSIYANT